VKMASWQGYVDFMKGRGNIEHALIISSENGEQYASSSPDFYLRQYKANIMQEDGTEKEEIVNEATNILKFMKGQSASQGLRLNGQKKQQVTRNFVDEETGLQCMITKVPQGGACISNAGKVTLIATFNELLQHSSPECNETVQKLAAYLKHSIWPEAFEGDPIPGSESSSSNWQEHVDKALLGCGNIAEAMLIRAESAEILATSPSNFQLTTYEAEIPQEDGTDKRETVDEMKNLIRMMLQKIKPPQGLRLNSTKYQIIRTFEDENSNCYSVYGKKSMGGVAVVLAGPVVIVAAFDEKKGHTPAVCNDRVSELAKYLKQQLK